MPDTNFTILWNHELGHIAQLRVDPAMFAVRFGSGCSMGKCSSSCCKGGVWAEFDRRQTGPAA